MPARLSVRGAAPLLTILGIAGSTRVRAAPATKARKSRIAASPRSRRDYKNCAGRSVVGCGACYSACQLFCRCSLSSHSSTRSM
jgi:hypothetical protein